MSVVAIVLFSLFALGLLVTIVVRQRPGGRGPTIKGFGVWLPKGMAQRANARYAKHGWEQPFDESGNNIQRPGL